MSRIYFIFLFVLWGNILNAREFDTHDSLYSVYLNSENDSVRLNAIDMIIWDYVYVNPDTAVELSEKVLAEFRSKKLSPGIAVIHRNKGVAYVIKGEYDEALYSYRNSERICSLINDLEGLATSYNGMGIIYSRIGNHSRSIEYYFNALSCFDRLNDKKGMSITYNNIGLIYEKQNDYKNALEYHTKCLKIQEELNNEEGIATALTNLASVEFRLNRHGEALKKYNRALAITLNRNDRFVEAAILNNKGLVFESLQMFDSAFQYYSTALAVREQVQDKQGMIESLNNISNVLISGKQFKDAEKYSLKSLDLARETGAIESIRDACRSLSVIYEKTGNVQVAYEYFKEAAGISDSLFNAANTAQLVQSAMQYEFDKREEDYLREKEEQELKHAEASNRQKQNSLMLGAGLVLTIIVLIFIYYNLQSRKKANRIISEQKVIVEEKNKEILDSIRYAKHIQEAILPAHQYISEFLPEHFILYRPKDIVSGDFYWIDKIGNKLIFAVVDCTGHGVPGAFVSIVAHNNLYRCVKEFGLTRPAAILDQLNILVNETLRQQREHSKIRDGMDIALCTMEQNENGKWILEYAGANNPLYIVSEKKNQEEETVPNDGMCLVEIKPDRQPVGDFLEHLTDPFTNHQVELNQGDRVYIFSDGYADQFGGPNGKKFKHSQLKQLLTSIGKKPMSEQQRELENNFLSWKGTMEQIDDICILGLRL